jgi:hypothetical protein
MKLQLIEFNDKHYASNILQADNLLKWNSLGSTHHLLVRAEYGAVIRFTEADKTEIEKHNNDRIFSGKEVRYSDNRFFALIPKGYVNNYQFAVSPAAYAVFCCEYDAETDICKLYVPNDACLYQCNVSSNVEVRIEAEPVKKKLFSYTPVKQYYTVMIPSIPGYVDGSLYYTFDGCKYRYPITKPMLGKEFSVPAFETKPPKIYAAVGNGYKLPTR